MNPAFAAREFTEVPATRRRFGDDCVTSAYPALANPSVALVEAHVCRTRPHLPTPPAVSLGNNGRPDHCRWIQEASGRVPNSDT